MTTDVLTLSTDDAALLSQVLPVLVLTMVLEMRTHGSVIAGGPNERFSSWIRGLLTAGFLLGFVAMFICITWAIVGEGDLEAVASQVVIAGFASVIVVLGITIGLTLFGKPEMKTSDPS